MTLFKGQLSLSDIMGLPFKVYDALRDARCEALKEEQREMEKMAKEQEKAQIRESILAK